MGGPASLGAAGAGRSRAVSDFIISDYHNSPSPSAPSRADAAPGGMPPSYPASYPAEVGPTATGRGGAGGGKQRVLSGLSLAMMNEDDNTSPVEHAPNPSPSLRPVWRGRAGGGGGGNAYAPVRVARHDGHLPQPSSGVPQFARGRSAAAAARRASSPAGRGAVELESEPADEHASRESVHLALELRRREEGAFADGRWATVREPDDAPAPAVPVSVRHGDAQQQERHNAAHVCPWKQAQSPDRQSKHKRRPKQPAGQLLARLVLVGE